MKHLTVRQLQELDPKRFEKEYWDWTHYAFEHEWWDCVEQEFTDRMAAVGVRVERIFFSLSHSQSDHAGFVGRVDVSMWMHHNKYDKDQTYAEAFPALYLATVQDGSYMLVTEGHRRHPDTDYHCSVEYSAPDGVFQHLDEEAWEELVTDQEYDADLEANIKEWVSARGDDLYRDLRNEYEDLSSEESFIESCECNGVTFEVEVEDEIHC